MPIGILGVGSAYPDRVLTNHDLEQMVETSDEWIRTRSGISERRIAAEDEATSDLAKRAGFKALEAAGVDASEIDLIIVGTFSPDTPLPATACHLMREMDIPDCMAFDLNAACTGWIYSLGVARGLMERGVARKALVVGADCISKYTNYEDRGTCVLFGDGAGAAVLGEVEDGRGFLGEAYGADGRMADRIIVPGGGSRHPASQKVVDEKLQFIRMEGNDVFRFAVKILGDALTQACEQCGLAPKDLDWIVPHQANIRIIDSAVKRLRVPREKFVINLERFGNTSAASVGIALDEAVRDGRIKKGDLVGFVAFGGGLTWGASVLRF